jgi:hypothetical protein
VSAFYLVDVRKSCSVIADLGYSAQSYLQCRGAEAVRVAAGAVSGSGAAITSEPELYC